MNRECPHCHALLFMDEIASGTYPCCNNGKIQLPPLDEIPPVLADLLSDSTSKGKQFRENIRVYNNNLAFASIGTNYVKFSSHGPSSIVIQGTMYHLIGSLLPSSNPPRYAQLYFVDTNDRQAQLTARCNVATGSINKPILQSLVTMMQQYNPHFQQFKRAMELLQDPSNRIPSVNVVIRSDMVLL